MSKKFLTSNSQLAKYRDCPALWGFTYPEGLQPKDMPVVQRRGRVFHVGMEAGYRYWQKKQRGITAAGTRAAENYLEPMIEVATGAAEFEWAKYFATEHGDKEDAERLADDQATFEVERWMIGHHFRSIREDLEHKVPILVEHRFEIPIPNRAGRSGGLYLRGDLDLVTFDRRYGFLVVEEHKSTALAVDAIDRRLEMDPQTCGYVHALRHLARTGVLDPVLWQVGLEHLSGADIPTGQVVYNVSRRKAPSIPNVLKDGTVSVAACDTTAPVYQQALRAQALRYDAGEAPEWLMKARSKVVANANPKRADHDRLEKAESRWESLKDKQTNIYAELSTKADTFFRRFEYHRTDEEIERWREEAWVDTNRMRAAQRDPRLRTRNPGNCMFRPCSYSDVCLQPNDATIRDAQFTTREERERERAQAEAEARKEDHGDSASADVGF